MTAAAFDLGTLASALEVLHARLLASAPELAPEVEQALEALRNGLEELRVADAQLRLQNDELVASQLALEVERSRFADLFDGAPDAYIVTDAHGVIADANEAAERLVGVPREQLSGKPVAVFVARAERRAFRTWLRRAAVGADPTPLVTTLERRGYARLYAECIATSIGSTGELRWLVRDVTERVQAERSLWELNAELEQRVASRTADLDNERAQLQELLRQMPVGVLVGDRSGRALRPMNSRATALLQPADGELDDPLLQLRYPDGRQVPETELPSIRAATTREPVLNVRYVLDVRDAPRTLDVSAGPVLAPDGSLSAVVVTVDDVTGSVRKEEADRDFVSNAAHQIRTPITAIVSAVAALEAGAKDEPAHRDRFLAHIARESDRLARLAEALLMLSRFARGDGPAEVRVVALDPLLRQLAAAAGERVSVRCRRDAAAITNASLLEQALSNVIDNALKHADGEVTVSARRRGDRVVIEVADRGPGMDAAQRERAVERFFRARNDGSGFGLGLAIAADAAHAAGAELEIESERGSGTRVRIRAPGARLETGRRT